MGKAKRASSQAGKPPDGRSPHQRRRGRRRDRRRPVQQPHQHRRILPSAIHFPWRSRRQRPRQTRNRIPGNPRSRCRMALCRPTQKARTPLQATRSGRLANPPLQRTILFPKRSRKRRRKRRAVKAVQPVRQVRPVRGRRRPVHPRPGAGTVPAMKICRRWRWEKEILEPTRRWIPIPGTKIRKVG